MKILLLQNSWLIILIALFFGCTSDKDSPLKEVKEETGFILKIFDDSLMLSGARPGIAVTDIKIHHPLLLRKNLQVDSLHLRSGIYIKLFYHIHDHKVKAIDAFCYFNDKFLFEKEKNLLIDHLSELYGAPLASDPALIWLICLGEIPPLELVLTSGPATNDQAVLSYSLYQRDTF